MGSVSFESIDLSPIIIPPPTVLKELRTSRMKQFGPVQSGIDKQIRLGKVFVSKLGLSEDEHDLTFHGGVDKAVHQYNAQNYAFWKKQYHDVDAQQRFQPGGFGENLVADGFDETNVCIGDLVRISNGDDESGCLLEVSLPRQPCFKLNQRFGIKNFAPRTHQEAKTGWYYRVVEEGWIEQGMQIRVVRRQHLIWSIARLHHYVHRDKTDFPIAEELAAIEVLGDECKDVFKERLAKKLAKEEAAKAPPQRWKDVVVRRKQIETARIMRVELESVDDSTSQDHITPGSHAFIKLPNGLKRAYSIVSGNTRCFTLGIALDDNSRGGSRYIHHQLKIGDIISLGSIGEGMSRDKMASHHIFIAGGVGITAFLALMARLKEINQTFELHYAVRDKSEVAFRSLLAEHSDSVNVYDKAAGDRLNILKTLETRPWNSHVYICGPQRMIDGTIAAAKDAGMSSDEVHFEVFQTDATGDPFCVDVSISHGTRNLDVKADQTLLETLRDAGLDLGSSCEVGSCGTCRVKVTCGRVEHRGTALTEVEKESEMLACVSRGIGHIAIELEG
jgi:MOSC domain-containing protein YiiM/ferredoxin-NADP reductase